MVISIENLKFFYISDDEMDFTVGIVSRNLARRILSNSKTVGISRFSRHQESRMTLSTCLNGSH